MNRQPIRVIKVGGSLLEWSSLPDALRSWLNAQPASVQVLVAGGGRPADWLRQADLRFSLGDQACHRLCLETLRLSARLLAELFPECRLATRFDELASSVLKSDAAATYVFCPYHFMTEWEPKQHAEPLPASWSVTTDSIAARLAEMLGADELVLLKSTDPPADDPVRAGYVDEYFAIASRRIGRIGFVNLRAV